MLIGGEVGWSTSLAVLRNCAAEGVSRPLRLPGWWKPVKVSVYKMLFGYYLSILLNVYSG